MTIINRRPGGDHGPVLSDEPDWDWVVRTHSAQVYRTAYRFTGNPHDAQDLTQDVFIRVFRSLATYTPGTFEAWLYRITVNLFLDQLRTRRRIQYDDHAANIIGRLPSREPTPAQAFEDATLRDDVQIALNALPPDFRTAVVLRDIEGLSYAEISAALGVNGGTVRSRIHRGRSRLRATLPQRPRRSTGVRRTGSIPTATQGSAA